MVNANTAAGTAATSIPSREVDVPIGGNLVFDLHQQEVRTVEVVALNAIRNRRAE